MVISSRDVFLRALWSLNLLSQVFLIEFSLANSHNWTNVRDPSLCYEHHVCTSSGKTYDLPFVDGSKMRSLLSSKNITHIHFYGDSYMRHIYDICCSIFGSHE